MRRLAAILALLFSIVVGRSGQGATISVGPTDSYQKIESAQAGDEVVIAPGTYAFRVHLTRAGTADKPIVIRALDPAQPPVWDLAGVLVENAPGSYTAGDRSRGCWQVSGGAYYHISGIVFANCHNGGNNSAGMRYYNGARGIVLSDCVFRGSDNGLTGGSQDSDMTVEYSEFDRNGSLAASSSAPSHNLYIYGGTFTLRYSYVHDPVQAQNFHIRAKSSVIEYNWFARAKSYEGDLMTSDDLSDTSQVRQVMLLRGNVLVQSASPGNTSQVIAVYNDGEVTGLSFSIRLVNNTFVGNGGRAALVHLSNEDGTVMNAELVNNIVAGTSVVTKVEDGAHGVVSGSNNWIQTGASAAGLSASITGADPGFSSAAAKNYTLAAGSKAIAQALAVADAPTAEYYRDEQVVRQGRPRASAKDLGAFESTTASEPTGPHGAPVGSGGAAGGDAAMAVDARAAGGNAGTSTDGGSRVAGGVGGTNANGGTSGTPATGGATSAPGAESSGCGCELPGSRPRRAWLAVALLVLASLAVRNRFEDRRRGLHRQLHRRGGTSLRGRSGTGGSPGTGGSLAGTGGNTGGSPTACSRATTGITSTATRTRRLGLTPSPSSPTSSRRC